MATAPTTERLLSLDEVVDRLSKTEPFDAYHITNANTIRFRLQPGWELTLDEKDPDDRVDAFMTVDGNEYQLTKEAALQASSNFGLPRAYVSKTPSNLIEPHLNYWYSSMPERGYNMLRMKDSVIGFTRPSLTPFSNLQLLEYVIDGIQGQYGGDTPIYGDFKFSNTLQQTDVRLIVPEHEFTIVGADLGDIPAGGEDVWAAGIHLSNSMIGKTQTTIDPYLFRRWSNSGATSVIEGLGTWSRKSDGQLDNVYNWAESTVNEIFSVVNDRFAEVQRLTELELDSDKLGYVLDDIFNKYEVPMAQRTLIGGYVVAAPNLDMYTVMNAITSTANGEDTSPARADRLMRIAGAIPTETFDPIKARIWREGRAARENERNPYEIGS